MTLLHHIHLPGPTSYPLASRLQDTLVARLLASKATHATPPPPSLITTEFTPTYTCGRRERATVSPTQEAHLRAGGRAAFYEALRGGMTTFHGPGQLVAYPVLDLRRHRLSPRAYVCALEGAVIALLAQYGVQGMRTQNPGVWVGPDHKICAVGVHLRRFVSSHGIGLNVSTDLGWFERIEACGLAGKSATSLEREGVTGVGVEEVGRGFADALAERLEGVEGVERVGVDNV